MTELEPATLIIWFKGASIRFSFRAGHQTTGKIKSREASIWLRQKDSKANLKKKKKAKPFSDAKKTDDRSSSEILTQVCR